MQLEVCDGERVVQIENRVFREGVAGEFAFDVVANSGQIVCNPPVFCYLDNHNKAAHQ